MKKGITMTVLVITIIVMIILASTITISIFSTINYSKLSAWASEIAYVQDVVDETVSKDSIINEYLLGTVNLNTYGLSEEDKKLQFEGEQITAENNVVLKILDLGKLKISNTMYGNMKVENDIYAFSETTKRVYYVKGFEVDDIIYYTLTENLANMYRLDKTEEKLSTVVFKPNKTGYSKDAITVEVLMPNTFTNVRVTTNNPQILISGRIQNENIVKYNVNTSNLVTDYVITVNYTVEGNSLVSTYIVNRHDTTLPVINTVQGENGVINISATDETGIKIIKYEYGIIAEDKVEEYFKNDGKVVANNYIKINRDIIGYTIYVQDNAGNYSYKTIGKWEYKTNSIITNGLVELEIGDEVSYNSGLEYETNGGKWNVLGVDNNGELLLISNSTVETKSLLATTTDNIITEINNDCAKYGMNNPNIIETKSVTKDYINVITGDQYNELGVPTNIQVDTIAYNLLFKVKNEDNTFSFLNYLLATSYTNENETGLLVVENGRIVKKTVQEINATTMGIRAVIKMKANTLLKKDAQTNKWIIINT